MPTTKTHHSTSHSQSAVPLRIKAFHSSFSFSRSCLAQIKPFSIQQIPSHHHSSQARKVAGLQAHILSNKHDTVWLAFVASARENPLFGIKSPCLTAPLCTNRVPHIDHLLSPDNGQREVKANPGFLLFPAELRGNFLIIHNDNLTLDDRRLRTGDTPFIDS